MEHITWRQLLKELKEKNIDLDDDISIYITQNDEFFSVVGTGYQYENDVLPTRSLYLRIIL